MPRAVPGIFFVAAIAFLPGCGGPEHHASGSYGITIVEPGIPEKVRVSYAGTIEAIVRLTGGCSTIAVRGFIDASDRLGARVGETQLSSNEPVNESGHVVIRIPQNLIDRAGGGGKLKIRIHLSPGDTSNPGEDIDGEIEVVAK